MTDKSTITIAAAAYPLDPLSDWTAYRDKLGAWVARGAETGAELLVFPEYGGIELAALAGPEVAGDPIRAMHAVSDRLDEADALHADLARAHGVYILAGSAPAFDGQARAVNRARFFGPQGGRGLQDKCILTRYERDPMDMAAGTGLRLLDTALGRIGVLICYDSEFPLLARSLVEAGAEILLVPSCTNTAAGYWRVRIGAMARALEGQCVVVQAPTVGDAPWCPIVDENVGAAALYGPPDIGFPESGILAMGAYNTPGWVVATADRGAIAQVRRDGGVLNSSHWPEQGVVLPGAEFLAVA